MEQNELQQMIEDLQQKIEHLSDIISYNMDIYYTRPVYQPSLGEYVPTQHTRKCAWQIAVNASYLKGEYVKQIEKLQEALQDAHTEENESSER